MNEALQKKGARKQTREREKKRKKEIMNERKEGRINKLGHSLGAPP